MGSPLVQRSRQDLVQPSKPRARATPYAVGAGEVNNSPVSLLPSSPPQWRTRRLTTCEVVSAYADKAGTQIRRYRRHVDTGNRAICALACPTAACRGVWRAGADRRLDHVRAARHAAARLSRCLDLQRLTAVFVVGQRLAHRPRVRCERSVHRARLARRATSARGAVAGRRLPLVDVGDLVLTLESLGGASPSSLSLFDAFYLGFYPLALVAILLFARGEISTRDALAELAGRGDRLLGMAALCAGFAFHGLKKLVRSPSLAGPPPEPCVSRGEILLLSALSRAAPWS